MTYCELADRAIRPARIPHHLKNARTAYENVIEYMLKATLEGKEFDEITANLERLRFRLEALEARQNGKGR